MRLVMASMIVLIICRITLLLGAGALDGTTEVSGVLGIGLAAMDGSWEIIVEGLTVVVGLVEGMIDGLAEGVVEIIGLIAIVGLLEGITEGTITVGCGVWLGAVDGAIPISLPSSSKICFKKSSSFPIRLLSLG